MTTIIIIFLIAISIIFITLYGLTCKEIRNVTSQLREINKTKTNSKILLSSNNKNTVELALEINKALEEEGKTQVEYKRIDVELRQAIANMSHDLRTPLTSIMGYIQLMGDDNIPKEEQEQYRFIVEKRAKALQLLINSFYDLSRLEANEYKFEFKSMNLTNIILDVIASFYDDFLRKSIEPKIDIEDKPIVIIGDENALRRVFSNLIQNMIKYGERNVYIGLKHHKEKITIIFKNDAPNLTEEDGAHLFERFFTGDKARGEESTGLGLAIVKKLIEKMGHKIYGSVSNKELTIIIEWIT